MNFLNNLFFFLSLFSLINSQTRDTPLDQFIAADDGYYSYYNSGIEYNGTNLAGRWRAYVLNMTSQKWLDETLVNKPIWWHALVIVVPDRVDYKDFGVIVGTGNSNNDGYPNMDDEYFRAAQYVSTHTKTIIGVLYQIPNEPLLFYNDSLQKYRSEDSIIAFGWRMFSTYDPSDSYRYNWLTHFPMAKATVKAMDTLASFSKTIDKQYNINKFAISGASKRGWSTWLTAAADERVVAFVPIVMDMPNFHINLHHMWKAYGGWTWAFSDYYAENITRDLDEQWLADVFNACDPYFFFDRFNNTLKMVIDATSDEFFMPDDEVYWWSSFPEPKYFEMIPDAEHSESTGVEVLVPSIATLITSYLENIKLPTFEWSIDNITGNITAYYYGNVSNIVTSKRWHARSCSTKRRDFRVLNLDDPCLCGVTADDMCLALESIWFSSDVSPIIISENEAMFIVSTPEYPEDHWVGFLLLIEVQIFETDHPYMNNLYSNNNPKRLKESGYIDQYGRIALTTQTSILPQRFPFSDCQDQECYGTLV